MTGEPADPEPLLLEPFAAHHQAAARALILRGLGEHLGELDPSLNTDLVDIGRAYAAGAFLVAQRAGALVGTGGFLPVADTAVQIHRMSVAREARGRGIGSAILAGLLAAARARGFRRAMLETTETWDATIAFYERSGFRACDRRAGSVYLGLDL